MNEKRFYRFIFFVIMLISAAISITCWYWAIKYFIALF